MELFAVKRYTDETGSGKKSKAAATNEDEILQKLLQKAEKRKRKHKSSEEIQIKHAVPDENEEENLETPEPVEDEITSTAKKAKADEPEPSTDFQVVGGDKKKQKVEMVLASWLAHPTIIDGGDLIPTEGVDADSDTAAIKNMPYLEKSTLTALKGMKIQRLFPVQRAVIPWILEAHRKPRPFRPRDICVSAPTGSGKTLAFAIPIVQILAKRVQCKVRALVVLPVAELALQVYNVFKALCDEAELEVCLLSKQQRLEDEQEMLLEKYKGEYYSKADIVVTTPGRLVDHLHATEGFCLKELKFLVIDEADRIMDAVFQNWLYYLNARVRATADQLLADVQPPLCYLELLKSFGKVPHKLLFSATLSQDPQKLQNLHLFQPKLFTTVLTLPKLQQVLENGEQAEKEPESGELIEKYTTPAELTEQYCLTELRIKPLTLLALVQQYGWKRFICFTNSADTASRLTFVMRELLQESNLRLVELSSKMSAKDRKQNLLSFSQGKVHGLICSDALARGIDVSNVDAVISYEAPRHIKTYIHRVGRTARAGQKGTAITLLTSKDMEPYKKMLLEVGKSIGAEVSITSKFEMDHAGAYRNALDELRKRQEDQKKQNKLKKMRSTRKAANLEKMEETAPMSLMEKLQAQAVISVPTKIDEYWIPE